MDAIKSVVISNKMDNVNLSNDHVASDLLDGHVLGNDKLYAPTMQRSNRSSLDANSVDVSISLQFINIDRKLIYVTNVVIMSLLTGLFR